MNGRSCILVVMTVMALYHTVLGNHPLQKRNQALTPEKMACIRTEFMRSNPSKVCTTVEAALELLYSVNDVISAIGTRLDLFNAFCVPSCGQAIINAWTTCRIYNNVRSTGELLINLCSANGRRPCYRDYAQLMVAFRDGSTCFNGLQSGSCSTDCRTDITLDIQNYGCCINIPIMYFDAIDEADVNASANILFNNCRVHRPPVCPSTGLKPPSNRVGQTIAAAAMNRLIALLMHLWVSVWTVKEVTRRGSVWNLGQEQISHC